MYSQTKCGTCNGSGGMTCRYCGGNGYVVGSVWNPYIGCYQNIQTVCSACQGYRRVYCTTCGGNGWVASPSFQGKQAYYAECSHNCGCKLYNPISAGNSYCATCAAKNCGKRTYTAHVRRYH